MTSSRVGADAVVLDTGYLQLVSAPSFQFLPVIGIPQMRTPEIHTAAT